MSNKKGFIKILVLSVILILMGGLFFVGKNKDNDKSMYSKVCVDDYGVFKVANDDCENPVGKETIFTDDDWKKYLDENNDFIINKFNLQSIKDQKCLRECFSDLSTREEGQYYLGIRWGWDVGEIEDNCSKLDSNVNLCMADLHKCARSIDIGTSECVVNYNVQYLVGKIETPLLYKDNLYFVAYGHGGRHEYDDTSVITKFDLLNKKFTILSDELKITPGLSPIISTKKGDYLIFSSSEGSDIGANILKEIVVYKISDEDKHKNIILSGFYAKIKGKTLQGQSKELNDYFKDEKLMSEIIDLSIEARSSRSFSTEIEGLKKEKCGNRKYDVNTLRADNNYKLKWNFDPIVVLDKPIRTDIILSSGHEDILLADDIGTNAGENSFSFYLSPEYIEDDMEIIVKLFDKRFLGLTEWDQDYSDSSVYFCAKDANDEDSSNAEIGPKDYSLINYPLEKSLLAEQIKSLESKNPPDDFWGGCFDSKNKDWKVQEDTRLVKEGNEVVIPSIRKLFFETNQEEPNCFTTIRTFSIPSSGRYMYLIFDRLSVKEYRDVPIYRLDLLNLSLKKLYNVSDGIATYFKIGENKNMMDRNNVLLPDGKRVVTSDEANVYLIDMETDAKSILYAASLPENQWLISHFNDSGVLAGNYVADIEVRPEDNQVVVGVYDENLSKDGKIVFNDKNEINRKSFYDGGSIAETIEFKFIKKVTIPIPDPIVR